jgi:hypothetical protein
LQEVLSPGVAAGMNQCGWFGVKKGGVVAG